MLPSLRTEIPGPRSRALAAELRQYESRNVTYVSERFPVFWQKARGTNVWDVDGNCFLDTTSAFGVAGLGFNSPTLMHAMVDQIDELYHGMGDIHPTGVKVDLCRLLSELTYETWGEGRGKTFLCCSGGDAVEAALKTAYLATGKTGVLAFHDSYHGLGYGPLNVTGYDEFRAPFASQMPATARFADFPECDSCDETQCREEYEQTMLRLFEEADGAGAPIGAILAEPIQGRGGIVVPPDWFLPLLRELAHRIGALLILDEIFTGFYRTGKRFACDHVDIVPDLICLGKSLTNGFPLAACVGRAEVMDAWPESLGEALHTSTFLGNPLGCRMAITALREMEVRPTAREVCEAGRAFAMALSGVLGKGRWGRLRGRGLMLGLELVEPSNLPRAGCDFCSLNPARPSTKAETISPSLGGAFIEELLQHGVIALGGGPHINVFRLTPAFRIDDRQIEFLVNLLPKALAEAEAKVDLPRR